MTPFTKTGIILIIVGIFGVLASNLVSSQPSFEMVPPEAHAVDELDPQLDIIATAMMLGAHGVSLNAEYSDKVLELIYKHVPEENHDALKADLQQLNLETEAMAIVMERVLLEAIRERGYENPDLILQQATQEFLAGARASEMLIQSLANRIVIDYEAGTFVIKPAQPEAQ